MFSGRLEAIFITPDKAGRMERVDAAEALPGGGLAGDRYAAEARRKPLEPNQEITLIESEALAAALQDYALEFTAADSRRNLLTRGVPLNHLVGREFRVGQVSLRGLELCEPCGHLEKLTIPGVRKALAHRGGLRAQILRGGTLRVGDEIRPAEG